MTPQEAMAERIALGKLKDKARAAKFKKLNPGYFKAWREANTEYNKERTQVWREANPERQRAYDRAYRKARKASDPLFKLRLNLSSLVCMSFKVKGWSKTTKTQALLGCTFEELAAHLQSKFETGMTLENHGDWHIDHIIPCATATTPEELEKLFHFTNLQPLWAADNLSKGSKLNWDYKPSM